MQPLHERVADCQRQADEAARYDNPIASREFILATLDKAGVPLTLDELAERLDLEAEDRREDSPWEDAIVKWAPEGGFSIGEALAALGVGKTDKLALYQIRDALHVLGYEQRRVRKGGGDRSRLWTKRGS